MNYKTVEKGLKDNYDEGYSVKYDDFYQRLVVMFNDFPCAEIDDELNVKFYKNSDKFEAKEISRFLFLVASENTFDDLIDIPKSVNMDKRMALMVYDALQWHAMGYLDHYHRQITKEELDKINDFRSNLKSEFNLYPEFDNEDEETEDD